MDVNEFIQEIYRIHEGSMGCSERALLLAPEFLNLLREYENNYAKSNEFIERFRALYPEYGTDEEELGEERMDLNETEGEVDEKEIGGNDDYDEEIDWKEMDSSFRFLLEYCENALLGDKELIEELMDRDIKIKQPMVSKVYFYTFISRLVEGTKSGIKLSFRFLSEMLREQIDDAKITQDKIEKLAVESNEKVGRVEKRIDSITSASFASLSIFTAIVIAFLGGFNVISSFFDNLTIQSDFKLIFVFSLALFGLFNCLSLFMWALTRIYISDNIGKSLDHVWWWCNLVLVVLIVVFGTLYIIEQNYFRHILTIF